MAKPERRIRLFIGVPVYGMVAPEVLEDFMRFMFHLGRRLPQYDVFTGIRVKAEQFRARNAIVEGAQSVDADYLLMLDDDMIINPHLTSGPTDDYSFVDKLVRHGKDIVSALYYQRTGNFHPVAMMKSSERGYRFLRDDELTKGLQRVDVAGGGAMLVNMRIFDKIPQPYFAPEHEFGTDVQLCRAAAEKGYEVWLDSSIELGHVRDERVIITHRNKHQFAMESSVPGEITKQIINADVFNSVIEDGLEWTGYKHMDDLAIAGQKFMTRARMEEFAPDTKASTDSLAGWYRQYPKERVARQIWYNTANHTKRMMTSFILGAISDELRANILDFGCGIGITAFELAKRGHFVTAADIDGTGTLDFLQWRAKKHNVQMTYHRSNGGVPHLGGTTYGAVIVMDCLEHIPEWRIVLRELASHLEPGGLLFSNNGILDDNIHPEHFPLDNQEFYAECLKNDLYPYNQIAFMKRQPKIQAA